MQYYYRDIVEAEFVAEFDALSREYPFIHFFQPSPDKAPWHVQAVIDAGDEPLLLNFWPHKQKAQRQGGMSQEGPRAARDVIHDALRDAAIMAVESDAFDVIEG